MKSNLLKNLGLCLPLVVACGSSSSERGGFNETSGAPNGGQLGGADPNFPSGGPPAGDPAPASYVPPTDLGCPSRAQEILALDFRSGWWSGGGGGGYSGTVLPAVVATCPQTSIDYHHFETSTHVKCFYKEGSGGGCNNFPAVTTVADIRAGFHHKSVNDYTQIWILSGSDEDPSDIPTGDALFQAILGDTAGTCIPILVGAGDGFMTHAKSVAQQLGMGEVFTQETKPPSFFSVAMGAAQSTSTISGSAMKQHLLFKGASSLADNVSGSGFFAMQKAHGDSIAASVSGNGIYDVIANDSSGKPSIAVGAAKVAGDGYRPFIFDAGFQRFYVLGDPGTAQYLKNIVMYMGLVGCKAAPIGPIK